LGVLRLGSSNAGIGSIIEMDAALYGGGGRNYRLISSGSSNGSIGGSKFAIEDAGNYRFVLDSSGNVGLGTGNPSGPFHVHGNLGFDTGVTFEHTNGTQGISIGYSGIRKQTTNGNNNLSIDGASNGNILLNADGGNGNVGIGQPNPTYRLDVSGTAHISGNVTIDGNLAAKYQDVAEWVPASEQLSAGTVVVLDSTKSNQVTYSSVSYDTRVAGVISEQPGIALGEKSDGKVLVATTGRVRVKVDATRSPIHIGDLLVTSDVPGLAMKSEPILIGGRRIHAPGTLIGKALEPLAKGRGEILVLLSLQ